MFSTAWQRWLRNVDDSELHVASLVVEAVRFAVEVARPERPSYAQTITQRLEHERSLGLSMNGNRHRLSLTFMCCVVWIIHASHLSAQPEHPTGLPSLSDVVGAGRDLWGEAAMRQTNGASYEFFRDLLPPPRYVHADYRYYPLILSAPKSPAKASLVSNGSGLNLRGGARSWKEIGTPVHFRVGPDEFLFGGLRERVEEPTLRNGYLPIVSIRYTHPSPVQSEGAVPLRQEKRFRKPEIYQLEAFASTQADLAAHGVVFVQFMLTQGDKGIVTLDFEDNKSLKFDAGRITGPDGSVLAVLDSSWKWDRNRAQANITQTVKATVALVTKPAMALAISEVSSPVYDQQVAACTETWNSELARGMQVSVPEPIVNNAWRNLILQNLAIMRGNRIHYSALNQYDALYESEGSDAALAAMSWGYESDGLDMLPPLLDFERAGLQYHNAGTKLLDVCRYYWLSRDRAGVQRLKPKWEREIQKLVDNRTSSHGLFPKERYCGDISTQVHSLNVNAKAWRALRDTSAMLRDMGEHAEAERLSSIAAEFRQTVLKAIDKSTIRTTDPPFVPIALMDQEPAHDPITHVRIGSYWNIIIGYTIASGIFPPGSPEETWIPKYQEQHGGLCMGMTRSGGAEFNFWTGEHRVNPLYGTRYVLDTLRRDDAERALVSFYGMLAQGLTRNTFVGGEGCTLQPVDAGGRFFYCPPNTAANAHFLSMLRNLLVQDWDLNDDGEPETLRLLFATSRRWLQDGQTITIQRAPTAFGPVSLKVQSHLSQGSIEIDLEKPKRSKPQSILLRLRLPEGWRIESARSGEVKLDFDAEGTLRCDGLPETAHIDVSVRK